MTTATRMLDRFSPALGIVGDVDRKRGVICGANLMQLGELNDDRPWFIDEVTLQQVVEFGSQFNRGLKARFTHPDMSNDGLGRYLGRWRNLRVDGERVRGDLHLAKSARSTPDGDLAGYVLGLAEEDPEAFGVSTVPILTEEMYRDDGEVRALRLTGIRAADVVDEPAATRGGFFSLQSTHPASIPIQVGSIIDRHFATADPEDLLERFTSYLAKRFGRKDFPKMTATATKPETKPDPMLTDSVETFRAEAARFVEHFGDQGSTWYLKGKTFDQAALARIEQLNADVTKLKEANEQLQTRLDAALAAVGEKDPVDPGDPPAEKTKAQLRAEELKKQGIGGATAGMAAHLESQGKPGRIAK